MEKYKLENIKYCNRCGIESAIFAEAFRIAQQVLAIKYALCKELITCSIENVQRRRLYFG